MGIPSIGLETLPIESILSELIAALPRLGAGVGSRAGWSGSTGTAMTGFRVFGSLWSDVHVYVDCRSVSYEIVNRIIEVLAGFGCPLYDPQDDKRFDGRRTE